MRRQHFNVSSFDGHQLPATTRLEFEAENAQGAGECDQNGSRIAAMRSEMELPVFICPSAIKMILINDYKLTFESLT